MRSNAGSARATVLITTSVSLALCGLHSVWLSRLRVAGRIRKGPAPVSNPSSFHISRLLTLSADQPRGARSRLRRSEQPARHWLIDAVSIECSLQRIMECLIIVTALRIYARAQCAHEVRASRYVLLLSVPSMSDPN